MVKVKALQIAILEPRIYGGCKKLGRNHAINVEIRGWKRDTGYIRCTVDVCITMFNSIQGVPSFNYTIYFVLKGEVKFLSTFLDIFEGPKLDECS